MKPLTGIEPCKCIDAVLLMTSLSKDIARIDSRHATTGLLAGRESHQNNKPLRNMLRNHGALRYFAHCLHLRGQPGRIWLLRSAGHLKGRFTSKLMIGRDTKTKNVITVAKTKTFQRQQESSAGEIVFCPKMHQPRD